MIFIRDQSIREGVCSLTTHVDLTCNPPSISSNDCKSEHHQRRGLQNNLVAPETSSPTPGPCYSIALVYEIAFWIASIGDRAVEEVNVPWEV
jgi:hypothetical protein